MRNLTTPMKVRIGIAFASSEIIMNLIGAGLGEIAGKLIGAAAGYLGFAALFGIGAYMVYEARRDLADRAPLDLSQGWGLMLASLSVSLDSLGIGFSILYIGAPLVVSLGAIFVVSLAATALGLMLGRRLGTVIEDRAELLAGALLALTGIAFALLKALHVA
jgi:putative Mn2+ efflux pump MntP